MNDNDKIILSLDASSTNVGWCLAQGDRYLNSGVYRPAGNADRRIAAIVRWLCRMINDHSPDLVAIEEPTGHHRNLKTDRLLARVGGNVEGVCTVCSIQVQWIHPMTVKATGFSKDNIFAAALLIGKNKRAVGPDEADAIGIWQAVLNSFRATNLKRQEEESR